MIVYGKMCFVYDFNSLSFIDLKQIKMEWRMVLLKMKMGGLNNLIIPL